VEREGICRQFFMSSRGLFVVVVVVFCFVLFCFFVQQLTATDVSFRYEHLGFYLIPAVFPKSVLFLFSWDKFQRKKM